MDYKKKCCANCKHCDITIIELPCCIFRCKLHPIYDKICGLKGYKECRNVVDNCKSYEPDWITRIRTKIKKLIK